MPRRRMRVLVARPMTGVLGKKTRPTTLRRGLVLLGAAAVAILARALASGALR